MRRLTVRNESWPIRGAFRISRGSKTSADVVVAEIEEDGFRGRGECVPYPRYGESIEAVAAAIENLRDALESGMERPELQNALPAGAARNAVDCALWDLEAKRTGRRVWENAGLAEPKPVHTAYTLSLDSAEKMADSARSVADYPLLKLKLGGPEDLDRLRAVHKAAPKAELILDANEGWSLDDLEKLLPNLADLGVIMVEQPLPAGDDGPLADIDSPVPLCADESCHTRHGLDDLAARYQAINIKLDKTGGFTEAVALARAAKDGGLDIMLGCMVATSLAMAPSLMLTPMARVVDLDGPLLLAEDRDPGLQFDATKISPPPPALWG